MMAKPTTWDKIPNLERGKTPDDMPDADRSVIIAKRALIAAYGEENEPDVEIGDLIADLQHLCDALNIDWFACLATGDENHESEINPEQEEE